LATTIQISEETQTRLFQVVAQLQSRLGRRVSYDEAITILIEESRGTGQAREDFRKLFGSLKDHESAWTELRRLKESEKQHLEKSHRTP
jgi:hypothetical protein